MVTGVSGSGKSSLAFDTLYAEGQRRYVESLSSYARQFLGRIAKPEVDFITGLPPAIAVEQKVKTRNSRSTVGTTTEIYDYLRKLYARIGKTISPISGEEVKKHQVLDVLNFVQQQVAGSSFLLLAPLYDDELFTWNDLLSTLLQQGFNRLLVAGQVVRISDAMLETCCPKDTYLVIDRFVVSDEPSLYNRLADSVETAFYEGRGVAFLAQLDDARNVQSMKEFSRDFKADGMVFEEPTEQLFSFNNPIGACPTCEGFGSVIGIDENLVIPNQALSVYEGAVACWRGEKMGVDLQLLIKHAAKFDFPIHRPYYQLTEAQKRLLWTGNEYFEGLDEFFRFLKQNQYKVQYRVMLSRYRGKTICPDCKGVRLKKEASYVKVGGKSITDLVQMPISELYRFFEHLTLTDYEMAAAQRLLVEIKKRVKCLMDVGLDYLTLNRASATLSGGESQRINLVSSLGSSLVGSLYVLDEPSIGLHPRNTDLLIGVLRQLQQLGNTVVVVEHDKTIMQAADYIIDIGPGAGRLGGEVVLQGDPKKLLQQKAHYPNSATLRYLAGEEEVNFLPQPRIWSNYIEVVEATHHNLKNVTVRFPLGVLTVVTGVSGSGKSTLVRDVLYAALKRHYGGVVDHVGSCLKVQGSLHLLTDVELVDQNPIGKSTRSNPATYLKAFDEIRRLYAEQPLAKQMGYTPGFFSFNSQGGRCDVCHGEGVITVPMQFMADVVLTCEACHGKRFKSDVLEVKYRQKDIYDVLEMTVNQAIEFFAEDEANLPQLIVRKLRPLQEVGLGYIKLGQPSSTLSGGESQRVKLASFLATDAQGNKFFIFDEPTTGLHFSDIKTLMQAFQRLIFKGHSVVIIEHNMDVVKQADYLIDLGPEGGEKGGSVVYEGIPEGLKGVEHSYTAKYLD